MISRIRHRGPDDDGLWIDTEARVGFAHRRLSIIDLSTAGHQPMVSADGRWVLIYNGEIYNHLELRAEIEAAGQGDWRGHSDTETLLQGIAAWGLKAMLRKCVGMFALALWDRRERKLHLARDRFGEKPLYYGWAGGDFLFASELKALRSHPRFVNMIDREALALFAARAYVPAPLSIYKGIYKLEPGRILSASAASLHAPLSSPPIDGERGRIAVDRYWSYEDVVTSGASQPIETQEEALRELEIVLSRSIAAQSIADVPVGAFLSGGIDSSAVVALYQKQSRHNIRTFTVGFEDAAYDEAGHARAVANRLGTEHHELHVTAMAARSVIPDLPTIYDEPFADSSQIPTFLISRFAREQVKVALTGDGADELFGGYNRYLLAARAWAQASKLPCAVRSSALAQLGKVPASSWNKLARLLPGKRPPHWGMKVQRGLNALRTARSIDDVYRSFAEEWTGGRSPVLGASASVAAPTVALPADASRMMYYDAVSYLPDDILCKVDRAAMAVSLETRVPFLDHRVAEVAARIPLSMKIGGRSGKRILRDLLDRHLPRSLFDRPKAGFAVPVGDWLRGPLRPWAEDLLQPARLRREGFFDADMVQRHWQEHLTRRAEAAGALWPLLMFQAWNADASSTSTLAA